MTGSEGQRAVLRLAGDLDDADAVRTAIVDASSTFTCPLQIELRAVTYLPSIVIGVLFNAVKAAEAAGVGLEVVVTAGTVAHRTLLIATLPHVTV